MSFTMWILDTPFDKWGVPVMGTCGRTVERVVVFKASTFKRLLEAHPSLKSEQFRIGSYDAEPQREGAE